MRDRIEKSIARVAASTDGRLKIGWRPNFQQYPEDERPFQYDGHSDEDLEAYRLARDWGYLQDIREDDESHEDDPPDGFTIYVKLTRLGYEELKTIQGPWWKRAMLNIAANIWSVLFSVISAVFIAVMLQKLGLATQ